MGEKEAAGKRFLDALEVYIRYRIEQGNRRTGQVPSQHVDAFGKYLETLGVKPDQQLYEVLTDYMSKMKDAGPARIVEDTLN